MSNEPQSPKIHPHGSLGWCYGQGRAHKAYEWSPKGPGAWKPTADQRAAYMAGYRGEAFPANLNENDRPEGKWEN